MSFPGLDVDVVSDRGNEASTRWPALVGAFFVSGRSRIEKCEIVLFSDIIAIVQGNVSGSNSTNLKLLGCVRLAGATVQRVQMSGTQINAARVDAADSECYAFRFSDDCALDSWLADATSVIDDLQLIITSGYSFNLN